jgi:hypothetical protein
MSKFALLATVSLFSISYATHVYAAPSGSSFNNAAGSSFNDPSGSAGGSVVPAGGGFGGAFNETTGGNEVEPEPGNGEGGTGQTIGVITRRDTSPTDPNKHDKSQGRVPGLVKRYLENNPNPGGGPKVIPGGNITPAGTTADIEPTGGGIGPTGPNTGPTVTPAGNTTDIVTNANSADIDVTPTGGTGPNTGPTGGTGPTVTPAGNTTDIVTNANSADIDVTPTGGTGPNTGPTGGTKPNVTPAGNTTDVVTNANAADLDATPGGTGPTGTTKPNVTPAGNQDLATTPSQGTLDVEPNITTAGSTGTKPSGGTTAGGKTTSGIVNNKDTNTATAPAKGSKSTTSSQNVRSGGIGAVGGSAIGTVGGAGSN